MGKGRRARARRRAAAETGAAPTAGAVFGIGSPARPVDRDHPRSPEPRGRAPLEGGQGWPLKPIRFATGLEQLTQLGAARAAARHAAAALDDEIRVAVEHLRLDGASWAQVGRALGITRQGARQVFGGRAGPQDL